VISAALDALGGGALMVGLGERHPHESAAQVMHRFLRIGTIDLRSTSCGPAWAGTSSPRPRSPGWAGVWVDADAPAQRRRRVDRHRRGRLHRELIPLYPMVPPPAAQVADRAPKGWG